MFKTEKVEQVAQTDQPIPDSRLTGKKNFFGIFGGEHIAATEFVIGATLVKWGCSVSDILIGLLIGNTLAVLAFTFICARIATETRLTLYSYIRKIVGAKLQKLYNLVWGICCMGLAAAGVSIAATAIREVVNIPVQNQWYPTSIVFVGIVIVIGVVITLVVANGFETMCKFSNTCVPWMICIFFVAFFVSIPRLCEVTGFGALQSPADLFRLLDQQVWNGQAAGGEGLGIAHVIAFAFICNLGWHVGLNDMSMFRFAKDYRYGYISAVGMFIGHFFAWIGAGIMGATAAALTGIPLVDLDSGGITSVILGYAGILAVIIAGWTTANPTIYRVALSLNAVFPKFSQKKVTYVTGVVMTVLACFPIMQNATNILTGLGFAVVGVGAIVFAEHFVFPKIGYTRYWTMYKGKDFNLAAAIAWGATFVFFAVMAVTGVLHMNFWGIPAWFLAFFLYVPLAGIMGAKKEYKEAVNAQERFEKDLQTYINEQFPLPEEEALTPTAVKIMQWISMGCLVLYAGSGILFSMGQIDIEKIKSFGLIMTISYFVLSIAAILIDYINSKKFALICKGDLQKIRRPNMEGKIL